MPGPMSKPKDSAGPKAQTCLKLAPVNLQGRALGLLPGDILLRLDGKPLEGPAAQLLKRVQAQTDREHLLDLRRDETDWTVLSSSLALGRWKAVDIPEPVTANHASIDRMRNWDVVVTEDGRYDAHPRTSPLLALLAPLYLIHMRLWTALAVWGALTLLGLAIGWVLGSTIQILVCLYVWRAAPTLFRADRSARGFRLWRVMAATSEADLHAQLGRIAPGLTFVLSTPDKDGSAATGQETPAA